MPSSVASSLFRLLLLLGLGLLHATQVPEERQRTVRSKVMNEKEKEKERSKLDVLATLVLVAKVSTLPRKGEGLRPAFLELEEDVRAVVPAAEGDTRIVQLFQSGGHHFFFFFFPHQKTKRGEVREGDNKGQEQVWRMKRNKVPKGGKKERRSNL